MKRSLKNGIMVGIIILMIGAIYFTINMNNSSSNNPPSMPNNSENNEPPAMPGENGDNNKDINEFINPPARPDDNSSEFGNPPEMQGSSNNIVIYVLLIVESLIISTLIVYIIMSNFNKKTFKETYQDKNKLIISVLIIIMLASGMTYLISTIKKDNYKEQSIMPGGKPGDSITSTTYKSVKEITTNENITEGSYDSIIKDENVISISGNVESNITNIEVSKEGDSDGGDSTSFYGTNSAIIVKDGAIVNISDATIETNATGANGVFSYGGSATTNNTNSDGTTANISNSTITTSKDNSGGIMTTGGGIMNANNLTITTSGTSSAAIRSDRGGGTVNVDGGTYKTMGKGSPAIYSTAKIMVKNAKLISESSEGAIIEGKNSITLDNVELTDTNNSLNGQSTTYKNVFLYQSMSGDAIDGEAVFTAKNSVITTNKGDSFYITNTTATINLENNTIINNDSNGYFLRSKADSWGNSGSNGGNVILNMTNQEVSGNIYIDNISTIIMNMTSSSLEGAINTDNTAKSITIKLDKESTIKLTDDSYITSLEDEDSTYSNIDFNGYKLYVNGKAIN